MDEPNEIMKLMNRQGFGGDGEMELVHSSNLNQLKAERAYLEKKAPR